jgi:predicted nuclease of restriction endonuclease-like (RecB) superfamily
MRGFSPRNLLFMRSFAEAFTSGPIVKQLVSQLPWGHIIHILQQVKSPTERSWYINQTIEHGWSRNVLSFHISSGLARRKGKAVSNFQHRLPAPQSELAEQTFKDPYIFDFLAMDSKLREREVETGLVEHITKFLLELGSGFAFVGRQVRMEVGGDDFYLDLLFYHLRLRSYVVVEIKNSRFKPEFAGQLNFYLAAVDAKLRREHDNHSIGLVLCREKNRLVAEYSLRNMKTPIGVAEFKLVKSVPKELRSSLPTIAELEAELGSK